MTAPRHTFARELRALLVIAAPLAAANVAQMLMGLTTTIMLGHVSKDASPRRAVSRPGTASRLKGGNLTVNIE